MSMHLSVLLTALFLIQQAPTADPYRSISVGRENCVGCLPGREAPPPEYEITLNRDGTAILIVLTGKAFDRAKGMYSGKISESEYAQLNALTQQLGLEKMSNVYGRMEDYEIHHGATMMIRLFGTDKLKVIIERDLEGPKELRTFQNAIESLAQKIGWTPSDDATRRF